MNSFFRLKEDRGWFALVDINFVVYGVCTPDRPERLRGLNGIQSIDEHFIYTSDDRKIIVVYRVLARLLERKLRLHRPVQIDKTKVEYDRGVLVNKAGIYIQDIFIEN